LSIRRRGCTGQELQEFWEEQIRQKRWLVRPADAARLLGCSRVFVMRECKRKHCRSWLSPDGVVWVDLKEWLEYSRWEVPLHKIRLKRGAGGSSSS
jgi:hypothetical protein